MTGQTRQTVREAWARELGPVEDARRLDLACAGERAPTLAMALRGVLGLTRRLAAQIAEPINLVAQVAQWR